MFIYKIENLITGKMYIGQTVRSLQQRIQSYKDEIKRFHKGNLQSQRPIIYSMNKYGLENFRFFVLDRASSQPELDAKEQFWISIYSSYVSGIGYNLDKSRGGVGRRSSESNKKTSDSMKGNRNPFYGKQHTPETLEKMSNTHKGKIISDETRKKDRGSSIGYQKHQFKIEQRTNHSTQIRSRIRTYSKNTFRKVSDSY